MEQHRPIHSFALALATCIAASPLSAHAGPGLLSSVNTGTVVALDAPRCGVVTPAIFDAHPSVPVEGSLATCTNDAQCPDANEFCDFSSSSGECRSSGLLERGDIYYVAGKELDINLTVPSCTKIGDVQMGGQSLAGSGGFDGTGPQYEVASVTPTTWQGQDALNEVVRIHLLNFGDGSSSQVAVSVVPVTGTGTASKQFTVGRVAAVEGLMHSSLSETKLRTNFLTSAYKMFGDADQILDSEGNRTAHGLYWNPMTMVADGGEARYVGTDLRIFGDQVVFAMSFVGDAPVCDSD